MCVTRKKKRARRRIRRLRNTQIHPSPPEEEESKSEQVIEMNGILCHGCKRVKPLGDEGIQIHCAGCNQFYCCQIAGTCYGPYCKKSNRIGAMHHVAWCIHCVPKYAMNCEKKSRIEKCICHKCISVFKESDETIQ